LLGNHTNCFCWALDLGCQVTVCIRGQLQKSLSLQPVINFNHYIHAEIFAAVTGFVWSLILREKMDLFRG